jgi:dCMP deaminase
MECSSKMMKDKFKRVYMNVAKEFASLSYARKLKVGAILVKDRRILSVGYNGTPAGWDNECETKEYMPSEEYSSDGSEKRWPYQESTYPNDDTLLIRRYALRTRPEVIHAEMNVLMKIASSNESSKDSVLYCTHTPCIDCAKAIYQAGIAKVIVEEKYEAGRGTGEEFLHMCGVDIEYLPSHSEPV